MINTGDIVKVDGVEATVVSSFASGKYRKYELSDGRTALDLKDECRVGKEIKEINLTGASLVKEPKNDRAFIKKDKYGYTENKDETDSDS